MSSENNLMIEITGSSKQATDALDKIVSKLDELQKKFISTVPAIEKFNNSLKSITDKTDFKNLTNSISKVSGEIQKMQEKSASSSQKSVAEIEKTTQKYEALFKKISSWKEKISSIFDVKFKDKWQSFTDKIKNFSTSKSDSSSNTEPKSTPSRSSTTSTKGIMEAISRIQNVRIDTSKIVEPIREVETFISRLTPSISKLSDTAQEKFGKMSEKLRIVNSDLKTQKEIYEQLKVDIKTAASGLDSKSFANLQTDKRLETTKSKISQLTKESDRLKSSMKKLAKSGFDETSTAANKANYSLTSFGRILRNLKTYIVAGAIYKLSSAFANALQNCMDFTENMNLFNVSLGANAQRAGEFVDKMSAVFGMDSSSLVRTVGNFYQISTAMGMPGCPRRTIRTPNFMHSLSLLACENIWCAIYPVRSRTGRGRQATSRTRGRNRTTQTFGHHYHRKCAKTDRCKLRNRKINPRHERSRKNAP